MKPIRIIVDNGIDTESPLWLAFNKWLGERPADYVFLEKAHKGIPDVEILDKLLNDGTILLTRDRILHNRACAQGVISFTLDAKGELQRSPLKGIYRLKGKMAPSVLKELKPDYTANLSEVTLKLTNGMSEKDLKFFRTRRRRIRSYFGSVANLGKVAMTIDATFAKSKALCGYVVKIAGKEGVKGLRASEGYCVMPAPAYDPAYPVMHALCASFYLHLQQVPTDLFIIPEETLRLCQTLMSASPGIVATKGQQALQMMLHHIPRLKLVPCVKGYFYESMKQKLEQLSRLRSNELKTIAFDEIAGKINAPLPNKVVFLR